MPFDHPPGWTPRLERDAQKKARKPWLKRCDVCGCVMRAEASRCGEFQDGHVQTVAAAPADGHDRPVLEGP